MLISALAFSLSLALQTAPAKTSLPDTVPDTTAPAGTAAPDTAAAERSRPVPPAALANAYLDDAARELVAGARARHGATDRSITQYRVIAKERISAGLRALRRDRMLYRREIAADILWRRDGVGRIEILGAREVVPIAVPDPEVPDDIRDDVLDLAIDPGKDLLVTGFDDEGGIRSPLARGSEADYRFASGDTTRIRLPGGREIRLVELKIVPRRAHGLLLRGSMWLDLDSYASVRGAFQLASPLDIGRDITGEEDDIPDILEPMIVELRYLTVEYGLWEDRWWMPRLVSLEGEAHIGKLARIPVRFERSYSDYRVSGADAPPLAANTPAPERPDTAQAERRGCRGRECWRYDVEQPSDSVLLTGPHLPESIYGGQDLISEAELRELADVLGGPLAGRNAWRAPALGLSYLEPDLVRYNRVEGLALGMRGTADFGAAELVGTAWIGAADLEPNGELTLRRAGFTTALAVSAYRRLDSVHPDEGSLGIGSALGAFFLGRDDSDYYRALGVEITSAPIGATGGWYAWRLYAEAQEAAAKATDVSLPWIFDRGRAFHENIAADPARQLGAEVEAGVAGGSDPRGTRWAVIGWLGAETGDFDFARPSLIARLGFPLPGGLVGGLEAAGGAALGEVPVQGLWYLGGPATVRGYGGASRLSGEAFWRGRVEVGTALTAARLAVFADAGWTGPRRAVELDPPLLSAGMGASLLDGLLRLDLSRAIRTTPGWRLDLYLDGVI